MMKENHRHIIKASQELKEDFTIMARKYKKLRDKSDQGDHLKRWIKLLGKCKDLYAQVTSKVVKSPRSQKNKKNVRIAEDQNTVRSYAPDSTRKWNDFKTQEFIKG